jgi:phage N-6-adenine-methyltransferase
MIAIDPHFKALIPPLSGQEYAQLETNILADGCRDPLVVWDGTLLDGHNRLEICLSHGLPFETRELAHQSRSDAEAWIIQNQFGRRNISDFVKAELALKLKPLVAARAKANQATSTGGKNPQLMQNSSEAEPVSTREEITKKSGVSHDTISKVGRITATGIAPLVEMARAGDMSIATAAYVADMPEAKQQAIVDGITANGLRPRDAIRAIRNLALLHTGDEESYTPSKYIESARVVMGSIDLDPASNAMAQETVKAAAYFTSETDGLAQAWSGNVWLNPPFTALVINKFIDKAASHFMAGEVSQAIVLTNNNTDTSWFHQGASVAAAICFTKGRINFLKRNGEKSSPTNGQAFFYFGGNVGAFAAEFSKHGLVMVKA